MTTHTDTFALLNEKLAAQDVDANVQHGIWATIGIPKYGDLLLLGIEQGFDYSVVEALTSYGIGLEELSSITGITLSTLDRRKSEGRLNTQESDKIYMLVRLIDAAITLFSGNKNKANAWIRKEAKGLGGRAPIDMTRTTVESESVMDFIFRLKHGVLM